LNSSGNQNISVEPVAEIQAQIARAAYQDFSKGSGHPAKLNFGDCFGNFKKRWEIE
jgi:ribonuclease VapC